MAHFAPSLASTPGLDMKVGDEGRFVREAIQVDVVDGGRV